MMHTGSSACLSLPAVLACLLTLCVHADATGDFLMLSEGAQPRLVGDVIGRVPVQTVAGRVAAHIGPEGWLQLPTEGHFDPAQGGLEATIRPRWGAEEPTRHTIFHIGENDARSHFTVFKLEGPAIRFVVKHDPNTYATVDYPIAGWQAGQWHTVRASWLMVEDRFLVLMKIGDGPVKHFMGGRPLGDVPATAYIGKRGPARQFADCDIAQLRLTREPILKPPFPTGELSIAEISIDAARSLGPVKPIHDCTTIWNSSSVPLPFTINSPKWRRLEQAQFSLARLVAFSENWLWGAKVDRDAAGELQLDFTDLDNLIDMVLAAGAEPYIRLAYHMPRALSSEPQGPNWAYSPPQDPQEWDEMIRAIVHHLNVERKLGVEYFVCTLNEADIAVARHGMDWQDILDLHRRTVRAALSVDPSIKVGGPAICQPLGGLGGECLSSFVRFCKEESLPLDFICFHRYRVSHPREFEAHLEKVRQIVRQADPELEPEWFCDEYSLWARDHTADDEYGAAYLAAATHYFSRAGLDKLSQVSFNDVLPPDSPPRVLSEHDGPFDRTVNRVERFLVKQVVAGGVRKPAILSHPPAPPADFTFGRYEVDVPEAGDPRLVFSTGIGANHPQMDGVGFSVVLAEPDEETARAPALFEHFQRTPNWQQHVVSLARFSGRRVLLELRSDRGTAAVANGVADHAAWGQPRIIVGPEDGQTVAGDLIQQMQQVTTGTGSNGYTFAYDERAIARSTGLPLIKGPVVTAPYFVTLMLNRLQGDEVEVQLEGRGGVLDDGTLGVRVCAREETLHGLVWSFAPLASGRRDVNVNVRNIAPRIAGAQTVRVRQWLIDSTHTNPWYTYGVLKTPTDGEYNLRSGELQLVADEERQVSEGELSIRLRLENLAVLLFEVSAAE